MNYIFHLLIYFSFYTILALSLNIILGYSGMFSLAHAAFFSLGAYTYGILCVRFGWDSVSASVVGIAFAMLFSLLISLPSWRLSGDYLLVATMAAQALIFSLIYNWHELGRPLGSLSNLTNGPYGIMNVPRPRFLGIELNTIGGTAAAAAATAVLIAVLVRVLTISPWGRLLEAIRDDELAAKNLGKNVRLAKVQALAVGCGLAAVSGSIYASYANYVDPSICTIEESVVVLSMVLVGGLASFYGPIVGALLMVAIPELLRFLSLPQAAAANLRLLILGLLLVLMVHLRPQGIAGKYRVE
jgi:branched-chain amino acid transport system permease protein